MVNFYHYNTYLLTYCPLRPLACGAATKFLHICLFCAIFFKLPQVCWKFAISDSTVRRHVILGRPLRLFPSGVQNIAVFVSSSGLLRKTWPIHLHLLLLMSMLISSCLHLMRRSWLVIFCGQNILRILLRLLVWNVESFCWSASVIRQHSEP